MLEEITNNPDGLTETQALTKYLIAPGGGHPTKIVSKYYSGADNSELELEATEKLEPYLLDDALPRFTFTEKENQRLESLSSDLDKYVRESAALFITGKTPFSKWDEYVQEIEKMKLDEYMNIQKAAYERLMEDES